MTEPVASVATAAGGRVLLERSPQASRSIDALRYILDAMRSERAGPAVQAALPAGEAVTFSEEMRRQADRAGPGAGAAGESFGAAPTIVPPAPAGSAIPAWDPPATTVSADIPLDIMQWARGVGSDERDAPPVTFEEPAPERVTAPDIARLAEAEENVIPRDVLEIMRARHLGAGAGQSDGS